MLNCKILMQYWVLVKVSTVFHCSFGVFLCDDIGCGWILCT